jgi:UDP-N-acetylmuramate dehydrogenase
MRIENELPDIKKNVLLKNYTTFKIGGPAKYFYIARTKEDLISAMKAVKKNKLPFFVLGGGSNLLVSGAGYRGLVIKNETKNFKIEKEKIISDSGVSLGRIIGAAIKKGLGGLEEGGGIPGTVGGAVYGNAGWPKGKWAIGDLVKKVEILWPNGKIEKVGKRWFSSSYRNSRLKKMKVNKPIILEVVLKLKKRKIKDLEKKQQEILMSRREKIPAGFSAGSVFKNPKGFFAGKLIEECGLKGKKIGKIKISEKHANFFINLGQGEAKDVIKLIKLTKKKVKNKFKVDLEEEIQFLGF